MDMEDRSATKETLVPRSGLKEDVRHLRGITQEAIRSSRYRIMQNWEKYKIKPIATAARSPIRETYSCGIDIEVDSEP